MKKQIVIIGGGLSGLTLAYLLEQKGLDITIIEASSRLGGRIQTIAGKLGTPLELGATWFSDQHQQLLLLLKELGLNKFPQYTRGTALFQTKSFEPPQLFSIPEAEEPSYRLVGGTQTLITALQSKLKRTTIILNTKITRISSQDKHTLSVQAGDLSFPCSKAIVCLPPQLASSIEYALNLPTPLRALLPTVQTWMAGAVKFVLEYERPFWREKGLSGMLYSHADIVTEMYDHSNVEENKFGFTGFLNGGTAGFSQEVRKENVLRHLSGLMGHDALHPTVYVDKVWNDEFIIRGHQIIERPHQNNGHPTLQAAFADDQLYFCGTETSSAYSGYMEGAVRSAQRLAALIN